MFLSDLHSFNLGVVQVLLIIVRVHSNVLVLSCSALGSFSIRPPYFTFIGCLFSTVGSVSLIFQPLIKHLLQNHFYFRVFINFILKEPWILSTMTPVCYRLHWKLFFGVFLWLCEFLFLSLLNVSCFLGICLCPHCEDGNSVLNSPLMVEKLTPRQDLNCNRWSLNAIAVLI